MMLIVCALLSLFYAASAGPLADQYIDSVLSNALPGQIRGFGLDPASLPDFFTEFEDKIPIIGKVKGRVNYTSGELTGLSSVRRMSACGGPTYKFGVPTVNCTIGFEHLKTSYDGKMKYGKMPVVPVKGKANVTITTVFIEVSSPSPNQQPSLTNFYFVQIGQLQTKFTGLGSPLNKFLKVLEDGYRTHVAADLMNNISNRFRAALTNSLAQIPMPR